MPSSQELVLFNPNQFQNRPALPLPKDWTTASKTLTSFPCFSKLPAELRLMIYRTELFRPRIITLCTKPKDEFPRCRPSAEIDILTLKTTIHCETRNPALLYTNREARMEALKVLRVLETEPPTLFMDRYLASLVFNKTIYANPEWDILAFGQMDCQHLMAEENYAGVQHIGLWYSTRAYHNLAYSTYESGLFNDKPLTIIMPKGCGEKEDKDVAALVDYTRGRVPLDHTFDDSDPEEFLERGRLWEKRTVLKLRARMPLPCFFDQHAANPWASYPSW